MCVIGLETVNHENYEYPLNKYECQNQTGCYVQQKQAEF